MDPITAFYKDCELFLTGGSGVVGKALIEKLLRSCNVRRIYLLLRMKKGLSVEERLKKIRNAKIFRTLRGLKPNELMKLSAIPGDVMLPNLGITSEYAKLLENVSIVFHCAATVRFDERLDVAIRMNVGGTLEALKLAETLKKLKIFMHVSTFFSNPYLTYVDSKLYPSPMDWKLCLKLSMDESKRDLLDILTRKVIMGFPNTYTFTKNLAESLVNDFRNRVPVAICRPSVVLFALSEPEPGYPSSIGGAMGLFVLGAAGIVKVSYMDPNSHLDITPMDMGTKMLLAFAYKAEQDYRIGKFSPQVDCPVYLLSSAKHFPHTLKEMITCMLDHNFLEDNIFLKNFMIPDCDTTDNRCVYMFLVFTKQIIPALLGDLLLRLFGRPPVIMSVLRRGFVSLEVMQPFLFNNYDSPGTTNYQEMYDLMENTDFKIWKDVIAGGTYEGLTESCKNMAYLMREISVNEDPKTLEKARRILKMKKLVYNIVRLILAYSILRWFYKWLLNNFL